MPTWFRVDAGMPDHPKVAHLAHLAGCSENDALACLIRLWDWCTMYAPDGRLTDRRLMAVRSRLDRVSGVRFDDQMIEHLTTAGWLDRDRWGWTVHDFMSLNGRHFRDAERKRESREKLGAVRRGQSADSPPLRTDGRDGTDGRKTLALSETSAGRTVLPDEPRATPPAGPLARGGFAMELLTEVQAHFPLHDVVLIARKILADPDCPPPGARRDKMLWRWAESARRAGTELLSATTTDPAQRLAELLAQRKGGA